jgi:hypothetical protein
MLGKKKGLVVAHKDIEHVFAGIPGVGTLHHGSVAGDDDFADYDIQFVIGSQHAPPSEITRLASAEARCRVPYAKPLRTPCAVLMENGTGVAIERLAYADPRLQAIHAGIYDSGVVQAVGRARGINRTAANPVDIYVFANLPLPMPVASVERCQPISRLDQMFLDGCVPINAADMARFCSHLFPSAEAAAQARHRWGGAEAMRARVRQLGHRAGEAWATVLCHPKGKGQKSRILFVRRDKLADVEAAIGKEFGGYLIFKYKPLTTGGGQAWEVEDHDIGRKRDLFLPMSDSSPRRRRRSPSRLVCRRARPPPGQGELF